MKTCNLHQGISRSSKVKDHDAIWKTSYYPVYTVFQSSEQVYNIQSTTAPRRVCGSLRIALGRWDSGHARRVATGHTEVARHSIQTGQNRFNRAVIFTIETISGFLFQLPSLVLKFDCWWDLPWQPLPSLPTLCQHFHLSVGLATTFQHADARCFLVNRG